MGARIFSDGRNPKDKTSLAVARRVARQMRRRRDRYLARRKGLMRALVRYGLMPGDREDRKTLESLDPFELRSRSLDEALTPHELGRALFHINQRRGFKSNRKLEREDQEAGKVKQGISKLRAAIEESGAQTLGEFLHRRQQNGETVRTRLQGTGAKAEYELYPDREMLMEEFDVIWTAQATHHPDLLSDEAHDSLKRIIFFQRPLKPVTPGKCSLNPTEERAPWALPSAQRFRIYQELNHLRVGRVGDQSRPLALEERDILVAELEKKQKVTFKGFRRLLKFDAELVFNMEDEKRKHLNGNLTTFMLSKEEYFGAAWLEFDEAKQDEIVERLLIEEDESQLIGWLGRECGLVEEIAEGISAVSLPKGYLAIGRTALSQVIVNLRDDVITWAEAAEKAGYHHSDKRTGEIFDRLPYYGIPLERHTAFGTGEPSDPQEIRFGKIANPTVHIGLNQLRRLVNAIVKKYGHPDEVILELARELKQGRMKRQEIQRQQAENQKLNDRRREQLSELNLPDTGENLLRLRLWEELNVDDPIDRRCVYTGEQISIRKLFSNEVQIEHILPFSRSLDNSFANKTVSFRSANNFKDKGTPYEAFGSSPSGYDWEGIVARAGSLAKNKQWRFAPDAMERFKDAGGFLDRHLTDTQYLNVLCREYLTGICDPNKVWVTPGRLTAMLRGKWHLNSLLSDHNLKERSDHRHHAIDAFVVGVTDRGLLNRISKSAARAEDAKLEKLFDEMPDPWEGFRDQVNDALHDFMVSFRRDHMLSSKSRSQGATSGSLHNDTAFGIVEGPDKSGKTLVVHRKPLESFKNAKEFDAIRDDATRKCLAEFVEKGIASGKTFQKCLAGYTEQYGTRKVRILETLAVIPIRDDQGNAYKAYKGDSNHCYEIFEKSDGRWGGEVLSTFQANAGEGKPAWMQEHPDARLLFRLFKDDVVAVDDGNGNGPRYLRVVKFSPGQIVLVEHFEGGNLKARDAASNEEDPFKYLTKSPLGLQKLKARLAVVDELGEVFLVA